MNKKIIDSAKSNRAAAIAKAIAAAARFAYPFYQPLSQTVIRTDALFWSVFGPAARYGLENSGYAYAALMKP